MAWLSGLSYLIYTGRVDTVDFDIPKQASHGPPIAPALFATWWLYRLRAGPFIEIRGTRRAASAGAKLST